MGEAYEACCAKGCMAKAEGPEEIGFDPEDMSPPTVLRFCLAHQEEWMQADESSPFKSVGPDATPEMLRKHGFGDEADALEEGWYDR